MKLHLCATICVLSAIAVVTACASGPEDERQLDPFEIAEQQQQGDLLDDPPQRDESAAAERRRSPRPAETDDEPLEVPEASAEPARPVDANPEGWDLDQMRDFETEAHVYEGRAQWDGPEDTSFSVAVDTDDSHIYFLVEVFDDQVVDSPPTDPLDAVVVWFRDPRLDDLLEALPENLRERLDVEIESGFAITPDGRAAPMRQDRSYPSDAVHTAAAPTTTGYLIEAAFSLEALSYLAEIPLDEVAFRIDVYDADDPHANEPQKKLSAVTDGSTPRFAITDTEGVLPASAPRFRPPRHDAFGVWSRSDTEWSFHPIEHISSRWEAIEEHQQALEGLISTDGFPEMCTGVDNRRHIVEAYDYHTGGHRVVLVLCGTAAEGGDCPSNASAQPVWVYLREQADGQWAVDEAREVFDEPLDQCPLQPPAGEGPYHHDFSLLPLDAIDAQVWGVGFHRSEESPGSRLESTTVRIVNPAASEFMVLERNLRTLEASGRQRTLQDNRFYLTDLDDDSHLDMCKVAEIRDQRCEDFNTGCETVDRGHEVIPRIELWDDSQQRFEDYLLTRHDHCRGSTTFEDISPGYKLLLIEDRLGLLPTMRE